ncbi:MAG: membrane protein insertase YidC [Spirochaetes bacterium]|jgi:YidC/Oxa1 family membrane protein insertase|nr:membrane protein insertase YidC [Spirochaetota bacterium]
MEKNTFLAFVLSGLIIVVWFSLMPPQTPQNEQLVKETEQIANNEEDGDDESLSVAKKDTVDAPDSGSESSIEPLSEDPLTEEKLSYKTEMYDIELSNKGARIVSFKYGERDIELALPFKDNRPGFDYTFYLTEKSFLLDSDLSKVIWYVHEKNDKSVTFAQNISISGKNVRVFKKYVFGEGYSFDVSYSFHNAEDSKVYFPEAKIIFTNADFLGPKMENYDSSFNKLKSIYYSDKKRSISKGGGFLGGMFSTPADIKTIYEKTEWTGLVSRYFVSVMLTKGSKADAVIGDARNETSYKTGLVFDNEGLNPGVTDYSFQVVVSEKDKSVLKAISPILEDASDTSKWIDPIRMVVVWALKKINSVVPNFGWSIVIFSILSKLILLPLTHKSTQSMKKMSELQPEVKKMKEKYKDKPDIAQKKMMELYKERGVNPMGGCLPMLVQMPFFIALYSALSNSLDMWNSPFILWIKDLSSPETLFSIGTFDIHLLPLIMTATSFLQQKVSATDSAAAGQQQMVMKMMPVFLLFVFWSMPSGLIIYWTMQNIIQVIHQLVVNRLSVKRS